MTTETTITTETRTVEIDGITYVVERTLDANWMTTNGYHNVAALFAEQGKQELVLRRPKGRKTYTTMEWVTERGSEFSAVIGV